MGRFFVIWLCVVGFLDSVADSLPDYDGAKVSVCWAVANALRLHTSLLLKKVKYQLTLPYFFFSGGGGWVVSDGGRAVRQAWHLRGKRQAGTALL